MTENENIEKAFSDLQKWTLTLMNQWKQTRKLSDPQSKILFEIRDIAAGINKTPVNVNNATAPSPHPIPKPILEPMEMKAGALFAKLDSRKNEMQVEQRIVYDRLCRRYEEGSHTGVTLNWYDLDFLRKLYGTLFYSRRC